MQLLSIACLVLALADPGPKPKAWYSIENEPGVIGYGRLNADGMLIDIDRRQATPQADPYGFGSFLNTYRTSHGLPPLTHDPNLDAWCLLNNQKSPGRTNPHALPSNRVMKSLSSQLSGVGHKSAQELFENYRGDRRCSAIMLDRKATRYGISHDGNCWTVNTE
jgi:hypothetical protein